eukprot:TRINITY_DN5562_c0_g1_i1.p1 TRINITY_DN5562_c0_g1~~TRINITY_DN5562_c0_g1_i1.p1  ORF type:complete len:658 (+),score=178.79 TRINITY_DN5562_c0_g1_i1:34-2007(+)
MEWWLRRLVAVLCACAAVGIAAVCAGAYCAVTLAAAALGLPAGVVDPRAFAALLCANAAAAGAAAWLLARRSVSVYMFRSCAAMFLTRPLYLSALRPLERFGLAFYASELESFDPVSVSRKSALVGLELEALRRRFPACPTRPFVLDVFEWWLKMVSTAVSDYGAQLQPLPGVEFVSLYAINHLTAPSGLFGFLASTHKVIFERDAWQLVSRLEKMPITLRSVQRFLHDAKECNRLPPAVSLEKICDQLDELKRPSLAEGQAGSGVCALERSFAEQVQQLRLPPSRERQLYDRFRAAQRAAFATSNALCDDIRANLIGCCAPGDGVWRLGIASLYEHFLRAHTGEPAATAASVHATGRREVDTLQHAILNELAAARMPPPPAGVTPGEHLAQLFSAPQYHYHAGEEAQALADFSAYIDEAVAMLPRVLAGAPCVRVRVAPTAVPGTPHHAFPAPADGSAPASFFADVHDITQLVKPTMRAIAFHEAIPGHLLERTVVQHLDIPFFFRHVPFFMTSYLEGWALYAEQVLAPELGLYRTPIERLGRLQLDLLRAARLVADTGLHAYKWTRDDAVAYLKQVVGMPHDFVVGEVDRYMVMPGQACAYKLGQLAISELREEARRQLGDAFDLRAFHAAVLAGGALPLCFLRQNVRRQLQLQM